jgi:hypothetical protein
MTSDDILDAVLNTRIMGLLSRRVRFTPSPQDLMETNGAICYAFERQFDTIFPRSVVSVMMRTQIGMGWAAAQQVWKYDCGFFRPELMPWPAEYQWWHQTYRKYMANTMEGQVAIENAPRDIQWWVLDPMGYYRGWMTGAVRCLAIPWIFKQFSLRDWAKYSEVHGQPIRLAKFPARASAEHKSQFIGDVSNMGNASTVGLPQGVDEKGSNFDLGLLEAVGNTWQGFDSLISKVERNYAIRVLGQNLTTEVDAGSQAAANVHDRVRLELVRADNYALSKSAYEQVVRPWAEMNYGNADLAPKFEWDCEPIEDQKERAMAISSYANAIAQFTNAGAPVDLREVIRASGLPVGPPIAKPAEGSVGGVPMSTQPEQDIQRDASDSFDDPSIAQSVQASVSDLLSSYSDRVFVARDIEDAKRRVFESIDINSIALSIDEVLKRGSK